jgi:hypothetical protein
MEIVAVIAFYAVVFVVILVLRRTARSDMSQWQGGRR